jgi:hypothetical protein
MNNQNANRMHPQMELGFNAAQSRRTHARRSRRLRSARWWFDQMRQVVDQAIDREPRPGRPEQIHFCLERGAQLN